MVAATLPPNGPPSVAQLARRESKADTFSDLRLWIKHFHKKGCLAKEVQERRLTDEHRAAIVRFLLAESRSGIRRRIAKELLGILAQVPAFTVPDEEDAEADGLPALLEFSDPKGHASDLFQRLQDWVCQQRQDGCLDEAGMALSTAYRTQVFEFLCTFAVEGAISRPSVVELLQDLSARSAWAEGGAVDHARVEIVCLEAWAAGQRPPPSGQPPQIQLPLPPALPAQTVFEEQRGGSAAKAASEETFDQLRDWVDAGLRSGRLAVEVSKLDSGYRLAITAFLISPAEKPSRWLPQSLSQVALPQAFPFRRSATRTKSSAKVASEDTAAAISQAADSSLDQGDQVSPKLGESSGGSARRGVGSILFSPGARVAAAARSGVRSSSASASRATAALPLRRFSRSGPSAKAAPPLSCPPPGSLSLERHRILRALSEVDGWFADLEPTSRDTITQALAQPRAAG